MLGIPGLDTVLVLGGATLLWNLLDRLIKPAPGGRPAY